MTGCTYITSHVRWAHIHADVWEYTVTASVHGLYFRWVWSHGHLLEIVSITAPPQEKIACATFHTSQIWSPFVVLSARSFGVWDSTDWFGRRDGQLVTSCTSSSCLLILLIYFTDATHSRSEMGGRYRQIMYIIFLCYINSIYHGRI